MSSSTGIVYRFFLSAGLRHCEADPIRTAGGKKCLRLCFEDEPLNHPVYRIAVREFKRPHKKRKGFCRFNVSIDGAIKSVFLQKHSLQQRFNVSREVIHDAVRSGELARVVFCKVLTAHLDKAGLWAEQLGKNLHFSVKHHKIPESIYIGKQFVAFGIKEVVQRGGSAVVKKARTLTGEILARRVCVVTSENRRRVFKMLSVLQQLQGNTGVIDLRAVVHYFSVSGKEKVVTFHSLAKSDLFSLIMEGSLSKAQKVDIAEQLLSTLASLGFAHADVKPENILVFQDAEGKYSVKLIDFEFSRHEEEKGVHKQGTPQWAAPEVLFEWPIDVQKLDVWSVGLVLLHLFMLPQLPDIPWFVQEGEKFDRTKISQIVVLKILEEAILSLGLKRLLERMLVVNPEERCTISESVLLFNQYVQKVKLQDLPSQPAAEKSQESTRAHSRASAFF